MQSQHQPPNQQMYWQIPSGSPQPPPGYGGFNAPLNHTYSSASFTPNSSNLGSFAGQPTFGNEYSNMGNLSASHSTVAPSRPPVRIDPPRYPKKQPILGPVSNTAEPSVPPSQLPSANAAISFGKTGSTSSGASTSTTPWKTASSVDPFKKPSSEVPVKPSPSVQSVDPPIKSALRVNLDGDAATPATKKIINLKDIRSDNKQKANVLVEKSFADFEDEAENIEKSKLVRNGRNIFCIDRS